MRKQRGYLNITTADLWAFLCIVVLAGGFIVYVVLPWLWRVAIKPALLWVLT
jgi:hypothetical protein